MTVLAKNVHQGGAYGCSAGFDRFSGIFAFTSYRDPNLASTLQTYDDTSKCVPAQWLWGEARTHGCCLTAPRACGWHVLGQVPS